MNRRGFFGGFAAMALSPFVAAPAVARIKASDIVALWPKLKAASPLAAVTDDCGGFLVPDEYVETIESMFERGFITINEYRSSVGLPRVVDVEIARPAVRLRTIDGVEVIRTV